MSDINDTPNFITNKSSASSSEEVVKSDKNNNELKEAANEGRVNMRPKDMSVAVTAKINEKFGADAVVNVLAECMEATKTIAIGGRPMEVPDYKIRLDSAKTVMLYQVGSAVTRSEVVTHNVDTLSSLQSKLQKSPALRRAVGNMIVDSGGDVVDVSPHRELSSDEESEAVSELSRLSQEDDTEVGKAIRKVVPVEGVRSSTSKGDASVKYGN